MIRCILLLLLLALAPVSRAEICDQLEGKVESIMATLPFAAEQSGSFGTMGTIGFQGIRQCPNSEVLWYAALRFAELHGVPNSATPATLPGLTSEAIQHAPNSARILTVAARITDNLDLARKAVALDPHYRPAQRALAIALAHAGKMQEALQLCQVARPTVEDDLTCASVLLYGGRTTEAILAARKATTSRRANLIEPTVGIQLNSNAEELLGSALLKAGRRREAIHAFQLAASLGSPTAQHQLDSLKPHP